MEVKLGYGTNLVDRNEIDDKASDAYTGSAKMLSTEAFFAFLTNGTGMCC